MRKTTLQNKLTLNSYSSNGKQTAERLLIYQVLRCFRVFWSQLWTFTKCLLALETTTNNQEVKRGLYRLCIIYPKIISAWLDMPISRRLVQFYRSCLTSRIHPFDFINISRHSRLINSNLLQRSKISVVEDNKVRSEEDSTSKQAHVQFVNKQLSDFWFHQVLRFLRVVSSQLWTSSKWLLALKTTTNNQEVKGSIYRLQNVNNLPKEARLQNSRQQKG